MFDLPNYGKDDAGGTSIEYGLIAAGIAIGISMAVTSLGAQLISTFSKIAASSQESGTASDRSAGPASGPAAVKDGP